MKPFKSLLFLLAVFAVLAVVMLVMPEDGIRINDDSSIKFTTFERLFSKKPEKKNVDKIIESDVDMDKLDEEERYIVNSDNTIDTVKIIVDEQIKVVQKFQYANDDPSVLYSFFEELLGMKDGGDVRVIHYGDSQIEGDRITDFLRTKMQGRFGGTGPGMVPAKPANNISASIKQSSSDNWKRYTVFGKADTTLGHKKYGSLGAFGRFAPVIRKNDTLRIYSDTNAVYEGWLRFDKSSAAYASNRIFSKVKMFYGNNTKPVTAGLYNGEELIEEITLLANNTLNLAEWDIPADANPISIKFSGKDSPDIYGISFEGQNGFAMDNVPMRGSSGLDFTRMDMTFLANMYRLLNVKLLILEFGVNIVPNVTDSYGFYEKWFLEQLKALKRINPGMAIIVIGVSDMSRKNGEYYESYPNVPLIRDAQRNAAFKAGCAFWDMYEAMGGENSMYSWATADPPLAGKDFTHFNPRGARIIAQMFYNAFLLEYNNYLKGLTEKSKGKEKEKEKKKNAK
ncbi:MAG: hypothetical protein A2W91_02490 [Bacteroidetes bacterium GWF2_38_335]|nr:MAG: hypothetical protein A2W91_02490 [Bacteroidetes bacterium GWF2_38_335]OFY80715.1 MAG: hypothetical protein A2281_05505 [Bacteroidetes bacterium RIFOXYA12_FULL_38_20]HBS87063.1 hypothetical protein [Bacteroidales bacterium]